MIASLDPGNGLGKELIDFQELLVVQVFNLTDLSVRSYQQMSVRVRISVEHDESVFATVEDVVFYIVLLGRQINKNVAIGLAG